MLSLSLKPTLYFQANLCPSPVRLPHRPPQTSRVTCSPQDSFTGRPITPDMLNNLHMFGESGDITTRGEVAGQALSHFI